MTSTMADGLIMGRHRVLKRLGGRQSSVFLIDYYGAHAIAKVFRPKWVSVLENEVTVLALESVQAFVPRLYEASEDTVIMEYLAGYDRISSRFGLMGMLPVDNVRDVCTCAMRAHDSGYGLMDMNLGNVMINSEGDVKVVDFENLYRYGDDDRGSFYESPFALGQAYFADKPAVYDRGREFPSYQNYWYRRCGVGLRTLMEGSRAACAAARWSYMASTAVRRIASPVTRRLQPVRQGAG